MKTKTKTRTKTRTAAATADGGRKREPSMRSLVDRALDAKKSIDAAKGAAVRSIEENCAHGMFDGWQKEAVWTIVGALATLCFSNGRSLGYDEGHFDAAHGRDQRQWDVKANTN